MDLEVRGPVKSWPHQWATASQELFTFFFSLCLGVLFRELLSPLSHVQSGCHDSIYSLRLWARPERERKMWLGVSLVLSVPGWPLIPAAPFLFSGQSVLNSYFQVCCFGWHLLSSTLLSVVHLPTSGNGVDGARI